MLSKCRNKIVKIPENQFLFLKNLPPAGFIDGILLQIHETLEKDDF